MSDEELDRRLDEAAGAYAARTAGRGERSADTRARVLASHRARVARRASLTTWLAAAIVLFGLLGGSTVWAYWTGRLPSFGPPAAAPEETQLPAPSAPPSRRPVPRPPAPPVTEVSVPAPAPPIAPAPSVSSVMERASDDVAAPTSPARDEEQTAVDPAERLAYRHAHALHFEAHDPAAALEAWDDYLAGYPHGRFALEARYNRALCLVRLDRRAEAESALAPFAEGTHGDYRRAEASALIEALESE